MNLKYLIIYVIIINLLAFCTMGQDKKLAINHNRRVSEKTLFLFALLLGAPGIWLGMYVFRHKTKHIKFIIFIPVIFVLNIITLYFIILYTPMLLSI